MLLELTALALRALSYAFAPPIEPVPIATIEPFLAQDEDLDDRPEMHSSAVPS